MGFVETKMINSDFLNEPLNHLNYIESIENHGEKSYMFDTDDISKKRLHDFLAKTAILFTHKELHKTLVTKLTREDWYYFFKGNSYVGEGLNNILENTYFSKGNFDSICEYMNMTAIQALDDKMLNGFGRVMEEHLEAEDALDWIKKRFNVDLSSYKSMSEVILSTDGWKAILQNNALMCCATTSQWFTEKVVEARRMRIWRLSTQDYYDDNGTHYTKAGTTDNKNITTDALELMKTNNLVTEEYLTLTDTAYVRLKDALLWFAQNESITALKKCKDILSVFCDDESCCKFLANNPTLLTECLNDRAFASAIFNSTLARDTIKANTNANNALNAFVTAIQTANTTLSKIGSGLDQIPIAVSTANKTDGLKDSIKPLMEEVTSVNVAVQEYRSYISVMNNLINMMSSSDPEFFANLLNDSDFVTWAVNDAAFVDTMTKNEMMSTALCANNGAWTAACNSQTYSNGLQGSEIALNAMLANETARNTAIATTTSMNTMSGSNTSMSKLVANAGALSKIIGTASALSAVMNSSVGVNNVLGNSTALSTVVGNSTAMNAMTGSATAIGIVVNSDTGMNAIVNSQTAMNAIVASATCINYVVGNTKSMGYIVKTAIAMSTCAGNQQMINAIATTQNAASIWLNSPTGMSYLCTVERCRNCFVASSIAMTIIANNQGMVNTLVSNDALLNAAASNATSRNICTGTQTSASTILSMEKPLVRFILGLSGLSVTAYNTVASISTSLDVMNNIVASSSAINFAAASSIAMNTMMTQQASITAIMNSNVGRLALYNHASVVEPAIKQDFTSSSCPFFNNVVGSYGDTQKWTYDKINEVPYTAAGDLHHFTDKKIFIIFISGSSELSMKIGKFVNGEQYQTYPRGHFNDRMNSNFTKDCMLCKFASGFDAGAVNSYMSGTVLYAWYVEI